MMLWAINRALLLLCVCQKPAKPNIIHGCTKAVQVLEYLGMQGQAVD